MAKRLNIEKPCPEKWETMKVGLHSRFCENCQKDVIDFTNWDRREILQFLLANENKGICGRVYPSQMDFTHSDFIITINALASEHKDSNLAFYLLTLGAMILAGCANPSEDKTKLISADTSIQQGTAINNQGMAHQNDTIENLSEVKSVQIQDIPIVGEITIGSDTTFGHAEPYPYAEVMPEFKGGMDSLMNFISQNLKYPDWERKYRIQGKVFVSFVVDKSGKIRDSRIVRTVEGAQNLDTEVLRVINSMPDWTPGQQDGIHVDVQLVLPIHFKL